MPEAQIEFEHLANLLVLQPGVSKSKMFGMSSLMVNGKAFAGLDGERMIFKLPVEVRSQTLGLEGARLFEPMAGRPMKEWVAVPVAQAERWQELAADALKYVKLLAEKA
jgi:hypothetical protein